MDRGVWWATVHKVAKSWTGLKQLNMHAPNPYVLQSGPPPSLATRGTSQPGIKPVPPTVEAQSLNHCTTEESPKADFNSELNTDLGV